MDHPTTVKEKKNQIYQIFKIESEGTMTFGRWALEDEFDKTKARNGNLKELMAWKQRRKELHK